MSTGPAIAETKNAANSVYSYSITNRTEIGGSYKMIKMRIKIPPNSNARYNIEISNFHNLDINVDIFLLMSHF
jgi:hypothetical protein